MKYLKMSDADLELNEKYKFEAKLAKGEAEKDGEEGGDEEMTGADDLLGGGSGDEGSGDEDNGNEGEGESDETSGLDSEILNNDVSPE